MTLPDGSGAEIGRTSFGVGIDLPQFEKDLDRAEALARQRAKRIQQQLGSIKIGVTVEDTGAGRGRTRRPSGGGGGAGGTGAAVAAAAAVASQLPVLRTEQQVIVKRVWRVVDDRSQLRLGPGQPGLPSGQPGLPAPPRQRYTITEVPNQQSRPGATPSQAGLPSPQLALPPGKRRYGDSFVYQSPTGPGDFSGARGGRSVNADSGPERQQGAQRFSDIIYRDQIAKGKTPAEAAARAKKETGVAPSMYQAGGGTSDSGTSSGTSSGAAQEPETDRSRTRRMRAEQQRAERDARLQGRQFSRVDTGQIVQPFAPGGGQGGGGRGGAGGLFGLSSNQIRVGAAILGIPLGINVLAGIARDIHTAAVQAIQDALALSQSIRSVGIAYGQLDQQRIRTGTRAFLLDPRTRGTEQQALQQAGSVGPLANQYGIAAQQVQTLVTQEGQLARLHGIDLPAAGQVFEQVLRGNVEAGQALGMQLTDEYGRLKSVGVSFEDLISVVGRYRAEQILLRDIQADVNRQQQNSVQTSDDVSTSVDVLAKSWDKLRSNVARAASGPTSVATRQLAKALDEVPKADFAKQIGGVANAVSHPAETGIAFLGGMAANEIDRQVHGTKALEDEQRKASAYLDQYTQKQIELSEAIPRVISAEEQLRVNRDRLIGQAQILGSLANLQAEAAKAGTVADAAQGPNFPLARLSPAQLRVIAQQRAEQVRLQRDAIEKATQQGSTLEEHDPRVVSQQRLVEAQHDQAVAQNESAQAQSSLERLSAQSDGRRLSVQQKLNEYSAATIQLQNDIAPGLLREAELRDRITIATQENFNLTKATLQAQQAALPTSRALADLNYEETVATQKAVMSAVEQSQGKTPTYDINEQVDAIIQAEFAKLGGAELASTQKQRDVELAQRAQQDDQLRKQIAANPIQQQLQDTQIGNIPVAAGIRSVQSQADVLSRSLQAADLAAGPERIAAETAVLNARLREIDATAAVAKAQAGVAGLPDVVVNLTIPGNVQIDEALLKRVIDAAGTGALDAIIKAKSLIGDRAGPNEAGAG